MINVPRIIISVQLLLQKCSSSRKLVILFVVMAWQLLLFCGLGTLFLLFVLLYSRRLSSHSCDNLRELLPHPTTKLQLVVCSFTG